MRENAPTSSAQHAGPRAGSTAGSGSTLREQVEIALAEYFALLDGEAPCDLYDVVMGEVEQPLLRSVMHHVGHNQSQAAVLLGISRGTLRKKLKAHGLL